MKITKTAIIALVTVSVSSAALAYYIGLPKDHNFPLDRNNSYFSNLTVPVKQSQEAAELSANFPEVQITFDYLDPTQVKALKDLRQVAPDLIAQAVTPTMWPRLALKVQQYFLAEAYLHMADGNYDEAYAVLRHLAGLEFASPTFENTAALNLHIHRYRTLLNAYITLTTKDLDQARALEQLMFIQKTSSNVTDATLYHSYGQLHLTSHLMPHEPRLYQPAYTAASSSMIAYDLAHNKDVKLSDYPHRDKRLDDSYRGLTTQTNNLIDNHIQTRKNIAHKICLLSNEPQSNYKNYLTKTEADIIDKGRSAQVSE